MESSIIYAWATQFGLKTVRSNSVNLRLTSGRPGSLGILLRVCNYTACFDYVITKYIHLKLQLLSTQVGH